MKLMTPDGILHLWTQAVADRSATLGAWIRGIYVCAVRYTPEGKIDTVFTKPVPDLMGRFKLTHYGRLNLMEELEYLFPGSKWVHEVSSTSAKQP